MPAIKNPLIITFVLIVTLLVTGCSYYSHSFLPQTQNVPLFNGKEQFRVNPSFSYHSIDVNLAYSPINHFGIIGNLQTDYKTFVPEIGFGTFLPIQKQLIFELYGGYGYESKKYKERGSSFNLFFKDGYKDVNCNVMAHKYFGQLNIGYIINSHFEIAFSLKSEYWDYYSYNFLYKRYEYDLQSQNMYLDHIDSTHYSPFNQFTIEPAISLRAGWKYGKIMLQTGLIYINYNKVNPFEENGTFPIYIRLGAYIPFNWNKNDKKQTLSNP